MYKYFYSIDGIRHVITSSNEFPSDVKFIDQVKSQIYISNKQENICKNLKQLLLEWKRIADELDIKWFLNGGSLLGTLRDNGLIFYDNDIDLVIRMKDYNKLLNYKCQDGICLGVSECGFNLSFNATNFPFIDIWVIGRDLNDTTKMTICGPIIDNTPLYYLNKVWINEWYYKADLNNLVVAKFENIDVFIPSNAISIVKRMYGENCLTEYRIEPHTKGHELASLIPKAENRMQVYSVIKKINTALNLDSATNNDGHLTCLMAKYVAEISVGNSPNKHTRIQGHILDFLNAHLHK